MSDVDVILRTAVADDAAAMATVDAASWPANLATTADEFAARVDVYSEGQWVAESEDRIVGVASAQRITAEFLHTHGSRCDLITDSNGFSRSHDPQGEIYQLVGVGVLPGYRGQQLGRRLVDQQIHFARGLAGIRRIVGLTRPAGYHRHRDMTIDDYLAARDRDGNLVDRVLAFHVEAGARVVSVHPGFRPEDRDACGYGVLIEYPLR